MPAEVTVEVPEKDIAELSRVMALRAKLLKEDAEKTVSYTAWFIGKAAGAATKVAPKLRPIVKNPNKQAKTDRRFAPYGVTRYRRDGSTYFQPIYRTGEFGRVRFIDKESLQVRYRSKFSGKIISEYETAQAPGLSIKSDKRRVIGRRGLARDSWRWIIGDLGHAPGQTWNQKKAAYYGVTKALQQSEPTITLTNKLNYADQAFKIKGRATVDNIMRRAANAMRKDLERRAKATLAEANK